MKKSDFASRLSQALEARGMKAADLSKKTKVAEGTISCYINGRYEAKQNRVQVFAEALDVNPAWLMGYDVPMEAERSQPAPAPRPIPPGFVEMPEMVQVPLIGSIACGTPITAEQNVKSYIGVPAAWHADFALECHGDSMAPTICDGDVVCIRSQPEVEQGQIAAVRIGEEATLKHCYYQNGVVQLIADNPSVCPPMVYTGPDLEDIAIEGLAVGFCRGLV